MRLLLKIMLFCLTFLFSPLLMASDATDMDIEAMPLRTVAATPIAYQNPPEGLLGELSFIPTGNVDPLWINMHQNKLKSRILKLTAGVAVISIGIAVIVCIGLYEGPRQMVNSTVYNCSQMFGPVWGGFSLPWRC